VKPAKVRERDRARAQGEFLAALDLAEAARERAKKSARAGYGYTARNFQAYIDELSSIAAVYNVAFAAAAAVAAAGVGATNNSNTGGVVSDIAPVVVAAT
jgi:hypothetical protein